jgi:single-stranded DNA-binding protein
VEGVLRYNLWQAQDGSQRGTYQIRVRAGMYSVFGKNKNREEQAKVKNELSEENLCSPASVSKPPAQPARKAYAPTVDEDSVPF